MIAQSKRRALVAGGAGFLGSHLCAALLDEGMDVLCLDSLITGNLGNIAALRANPRFTFLIGDVADPLSGPAFSGPFAEIYNLACAASPPAYQIDPEHTLITSVVGTQQLLRIAERCGARFLLTSTSEIYGDPLEHPQHESYRGNVNPIGPRACYDEGKRAAETLAFDFDRAGRANVRVARIFNTYGPRLAALDGRVVSNMIVQALEGEALTVYGDGEQTRSFCFVDDMIAGLIALMRYEGPQPGPVNLGNPDETTVNDLAERIVRLTHSPAAIVHRPLPIDDPQRRKPDIGRARTILGWQPSISLDAGLLATIAWFSPTRAASVQAPLVAAIAQ